MNNKNGRFKQWVVFLVAVIGIIGLGRVLGWPFFLETLAAILKTLGLVSAMFIFGFFCLHILKKDDHPIEFSTAFSVGLMITTAYFFLAAFLRILITPVMILFYVLPLPLLWWLLKKQQKNLLTSIFTFFKRSQWEYPLFLLPLLFAVLPPTFYDTLVYHLGIPNLYLLHGGFIETPQLMYANTSIYYEISLIPAVFAGKTVPNLFHFAVGIIFIFMAADMGHRFLGLQKRNLFVLFAVSIPMSVFLLSTVKNDLVSALFILLGIRALLTSSWAQSGLFWGFAVGIKYFNMLPILIFLLLYFIKERTCPYKQVLKMSGVGFLVLLPLFLKNLYYIGNPVFPFFWQYFPTPYWDVSRNAAMVADVGRMFYSFKEALLLPYTLSFSQVGFGGMVGMQFLLFLPLLFLAKERVKAYWHFLLFGLLTIFISGYFTGSIRFLYIALIVLVFFLVMVYEALNNKIIKGLIWLVLVLNILHGVLLQEQMTRASRLYLANKSAEDYLSSMFPTYAAFQYVNINTPPLSRVLVAGEARNFYLQRQYWTSSALDFSILKKYLVSARTVEQFLDLLRQDGINYMIINMSELYRLQKTYTNLETDMFDRLKNFLDALQDYIIFQHGASFVYRFQ